MIIFWLAIAAMTIGATALVVLPLIRQRTDTLLTAERQQRMAVYKDRRREIEREQQTGRLDADDARAAIDALAADAATTMTDPATAAQPASAKQISRWPAAVMVALLIPAVAIAVYRTLGVPTLADPAAVAAANTRDNQADEADPSPEQIAKALAELRDRTRKEPDNAQAWAMLAQALRMTDDLPGALDAYASALTKAPGNARLMAEYAETQAAANRGNFSGKPLALLEQAIAIAPDDPKVLALMGAARYRLGEPERALVYLRKLMLQLPVGSEQAGHIDSVIQRISGEVAARQGSAAPAPQQAPAAAGAPARSAPASGATISGRITVADALRQQVDPKATLFIYARAAEGPRIPYAAIRVTADRLPMDFTLSDDQAMDPQRRLSDAGPVIIEARISRSGNAIRQSGDLAGQSTAVRPGARDLVINIDQTVP